MVTFDILSMPKDLLMFRQLITFIIGSSHGGVDDVVKDETYEACLLIRIQTASPRRETGVSATVKVEGQRDSPGASVLLEKWQTHLSRKKKRSEFPLKRKLKPLCNWLFSRCYSRGKFLQN